MQFGSTAASVLVGSLAYNVAGFIYDRLNDPRAKVPFAWIADIPVGLIQTFDPLVLDLAGDGITTTALGAAGTPGASTTHFDFGRDGFGERTGWINPADGNGRIDGITELFGAPTQDGFAVLDTIDTNLDGGRTDMR
jgi:hypothetical protein